MNSDTLVARVVLTAVKVSCKSESEACSSLLVEFKSDFNSRSSATVCETNQQVLS